MLKVAERPAQGKVQAATPPKFHTVSDTRKTGLWLDKMVADAGAKVTSVTADLTPDLASILLERNPANRPLKRSKVEDFAKDMKSGAWKFNGEPIIVAQDGLLNDGQHRCLAVKESKVTVPVVMVFGVARDTRDTLDQGVNRTIGDYLALHGQHYSNHIAAVAKALWQWRSFGFVRDGGTYRPTRSEILKVALETPGIVKSFDYINRAGAHVFGSLAVLAFAHFAFKSVAGELAANLFMDRLIEGSDLKAGDPILNVRNRLIADRKALRLGDKAELLFRAWNAHRLDETRVLFRVAGGELPLLEA